MLKNKYKAFQNSFNPHTPLTAGLNIFEKTFHSRRKRMHTLLHMQINMTTKPELKEFGLCLSTIPSKPIQKKKKFLHSLYKLLVHGPLTEQAASKVRYHSFKNGIKTHYSPMPPLKTNSRTNKILHLLQTWLLVNKIGHKNIDIQLRKQWNKMLLHFNLLSVSNEVSLTKWFMPYVAVRQQMLRHSYNMVTLLLTLHTTSTANLVSLP